MPRFMIYPHHHGGGIRRGDAKNLAPAINGRAILAIGLALALAACATPSARTPEGVEKASAFVETAVADAEKVARRALAYHSANIRKRAAIEVEEAEVILQKALDQQERIRNVQRAAIAVLAELQAKVPQGQKVTAAVERVDRISAILAATDRNIETIEQTVIVLQELEIPGRL